MPLTYKAETGENEEKKLEKHNDDHLEPIDCFSTVMVPIVQLCSTATPH